MKTHETLFQLLPQVVAAGSVTVAYPFDTVRRRLMMMSGEKEKMYKVKVCLSMCRLAVEKLVHPFRGE